MATLTDGARETALCLAIFVCYTNELLSAYRFDIYLKDYRVSITSLNVIFIVKICQK